MSWRETLGVATSPQTPSTHNSQNTQKPREAGNSADIADSAYRDSEQENSKLLDTVLADTCQEHGLDPAAIRAELVDDWPDLTPAALRCFIRCKAQERRNLDAQPLADKLRAYGKPWPLKVDGRVVCWLVADEAAKRAHRGPEPVYSASEVETLANLPDDEAKALHALRERFAGTIREVAE